MALETSCSAEAQEKGRPVITQAARLRPSQEGDTARPGLARREGRVQARGRPSRGGGWDTPYGTLGHGDKAGGHPCAPLPTHSSSQRSQQNPGPPAAGVTCVVSQQQVSCLPSPRPTPAALPAASVPFPRSGSPGPAPRSPSPSKSSQNQIISVTSVHWATPSRPCPASPGRTLSAPRELHLDSPLKRYVFPSLPSPGNWPWLPASACGSGSSSCPFWP